MAEKGHKFKFLKNSLKNKPFKPPQPSNLYGIFAFTFALFSLLLLKRRK
jgi:hypothetical protein